MTLKGLLRKVTTSQDDVDRDKLLEFCARSGVTTTIGAMKPREEATVAGQIASLRVVPSNHGSPWLEATVQDGTGSLVVLWTGRRRIAGIRPGARLVVTGRPTPAGHTGRPTLYNPVYELLG